MPVAVQIWHDLRLVPLHDEASGLHFRMDVCVLPI